MSSKEPPQIPRPPLTRAVTFTVTGDKWIEEIYRQLEWLKSLTPKEIDKQTKVKIE